MCQLRPNKREFGSFSRWTILNVFFVDHALQAWFLPFSGLITKDKLVNTEAVLTAINCLILGMTSMGVLVFLSMHVYLVAYGLTASEESKAAMSIYIYNSNYNQFLYKF